MIQTTIIDKTVQPGAIRDDMDYWIMIGAELQELDQFNDQTILKKDLLHTM